MRFADLAQHACELRVLGPVLVSPVAQERVLLGVDARRRVAGDARGEGAVLVDALDHAQERIDHVGVELAAAAALELVEAVLVSQGLAVRPAERHGIVGVGDAHRARDLGDRLTGEAVGVALARPAFVVVADAGDQRVVEERADDVGAEDGMLAHQFPFLHVEPARLEQHAVGHADLADVVQVRRFLDRAQPVLGPAELASEQHHVGGDAGGVAERVVVLRVQCPAQRLQVAEVHPLVAFVQVGVADRQGELGADALEEVPVHGDERVARRGAEAEQAQHVLALRYGDDGGGAQAVHAGVGEARRGAVRQVQHHDALAAQPFEERSRLDPGRFARRRARLAVAGVDDLEAVAGPAQREHRPVARHELAKLVDRARRDLFELEAGPRRSGDLVQQRVLAVRELKVLYQVGVIDGQRGDPADGDDGRRVLGREAVPGALLRELQDADDAFLGDQRHEQGAGLAVLLHEPALLGAERRVIRAAHFDRLAVVDCLAHRRPVVEGEAAPLPALVDAAVFDAGHTLEQATVTQRVDVARRHARHLAEALGGRAQDLTEVEGRGEFVAHVADERHAVGVPVEAVEQRRVGQSVRGSLGEAVNEVEVLELARVIVVDPGASDDPAAADQRHLEASRVPPAQVLATLELREPWIVRDVGDDERALCTQGGPHEVELVERVGGAYVVGVGLAMVDAGHAAHGGALEHEDVAVGRGGGGAQPPRDAADHVVELEGGAELDAGVDEEAQHLVGLLDLLQQDGAVESSGDDLPDAGEEVHVLRVVALAMVVHVDEPDDAVTDRQREADLAPRAGLTVQLALVVAQPGVAGMRDHQRLTLLQRIASAGEEVQIERPADEVVLVLALVVGQRAVELVAPHCEDLTTVGAHDVRHPWADRPHQPLQAARLGHHLPQLDELRQGGVPALELAEEKGVLDRPGGHLADAAQEVEVVGVVPRTSVEDVDEADDCLAGHKRDAQLAPVAELGHVGAFFVGEDRVVDVDDRHGPAAAERQGSGRERLDVQHLADDALVEPGLVGADDAAQPLVLQREDVAVGGVGGAAQALRQGLQEVLEVALLRADRGELDDLSEYPRAMLELAHQQRALECGGERLPGALQEAEVLGVGALPGVVDVDEAVELAARHQRDAHFAGDAVIAIRAAFAVGELGIVGARHHERLVGLHRGCDGRVDRSIERPPHRALVVTASVEAGQAAEDLTVEAVDVAVARIDRTEQPLGEARRDRLDVLGASGQSSELDELVQHAAPSLDLLEQGRVTESVGGDLAEAAYQLQIVAEVAGRVVRELDETQHAAA